MYLYNVTCILENDIAQEWLTWMNEIHIPEVMQTQKFSSFRLLKVIDSPNEGQTYCIQYVAESLADYQAYQQTFAPALQAQVKEKYGEKLIAYRSLMEYIK